MATDNRKVVRVSPEVERLIRDHATGKGISLGDAADALVLTGHARLTALQRYAKKGVKKAKR